MQLILGLSQDGFIAKSKNDNLEWLKSDKKLFRLLSSTNQGINLVSELTSKLMPAELKGRKLITLSRKKITIDDAFKNWPNANFLGGQTLAKIALEKNYITDCFIFISPIILTKGIKFNLQNLLVKNFKINHTFVFDKIQIIHWKYNA